jgi:hypothetical protein
MISIPNLFDTFNKKTNLTEWLLKNQSYTVHYGRAAMS